MRNTKLSISASLLLMSLFANAQWISLNSGITADLTVISQNDAGSIFLGGGEKQTNNFYGIIIKSDNGGITWNTVANHLTPFTDIDFLTANKGVAISNSSDTIFTTADGGNTWLKKYSQNCSGPYRGFPEVVFTDSLTGYAPGYKTIDGGDSWFSQFPYVQMFPYLPLGITFLNDSTGIVAGFEYWGAMPKTTDRGATWNWVQVPYYTWEIYSIHFPSQNIGYATSLKYQTIKESEIMKTTDGGDTWNSIYTTALSSLFLSIFCTDDNTCYAAGYNGIIAKTTDGGNSWTPQYSGTTQTLTKVFFTDSITGYIVGDSGTVLKTINGGGFTNINTLTNFQAVSVISNFADHTLMLAINSNDIPTFQFELFNSSGQKVIDKIFHGKTNTVNLSSLQNEIYFYRIVSDGNIIKTGKILSE